VVSFTVATDAALDAVAASVPEETPLLSAVDTRSDCEVSRLVCAVLLTRLVDWLVESVADFTSAVDWLAELVADCVAAVERLAEMTTDWLTSLLARAVSFTVATDAALDAVAARVPLDRPLESAVDMRRDWEASLLVDAASLTTFEDCPVELVADCATMVDRFAEITTLSLTALESAAVAMLRAVESVAAPPAAVAVDCAVDMRID
jgi:hypothetical protein